MSRRTEISPKDQPPVKRIRLEITWVGQCDEESWVAVLVPLIEDYDFSQTTRVVDWECLTHHGETRHLSREELIAFGYKPRKPGPGFWQALWWRLRGWWLGGWLR